ncbi:MAG TPA: hypothetical protein DCZ92_05045 [Elusimicrobia bacterium]|nr:MAG: hypothetical protein A2016_12745 [Elusimicrobia bacterium GWF2_62_30]HBA60173.1 hypothetical protein [Elusimicrobiota bacterium]
MWKTALIGVLSFPFSGLAFVIGWAARDLRTGVIAGAAVFTVFFVASIVSLFFIKTYTYLDAALPLVFAVFWSAALAPFSFGASLFSAPAFIGAALVLGACMALAKRWETDKRWLIFPAIVFLYEMLPLNIPGQFDDLFALSGSVGYSLVLFLKRAWPQIVRELAEKHLGRTEEPRG